MKHMNPKLAKLLYEGFSIITLENLNNNQINALYERVKKAETKEEETKLTKVYNLGDKNDKDKFIDAAKNVTDKNKVNFDSTNDTASVSEKEIKEKAVSKKQQQFFGIVRGMQKGDIPKRGKAGKVSNEISVKDAKDFAETKHKGLPKKVETKEESKNFIQKATKKMEKKGTEGSFSEYCGGKVTMECIKKGMKSDDPKIVKKANFAKNIGGYKGADHGEKNEVKKLEENILKLVNNYMNPHVTKNEIVSMINKFKR